MNSNVTHFDHSPGSEPLDWDQAVRVAATRLNEQHVVPDTMGHKLLGDETERLGDEAEGLAALLCAYGKLAEEVACRHPPADEPLISQQLPHKHHRVTSVGELPGLAVAAVLAISAEPIELTTIDRA
jgi:hypothetical protein